MSTELDRARADLERTTLPAAADIRRRGDTRRQRRTALGGAFSVAVLVAGVVLGLSARSPARPHPPGSTGPSASPVVTRPTLTDVYPDPLVLDFGGIGPYRIGTPIDVLEAAGLVDEFSPAPGCVTVEATGRYAGTLMLIIRDGRLVDVGTAGGLEIHSLAGAAVGMTFDQVRALYPGQARTRPGSGEHAGVYVTRGDETMLFSGHPIQPGVGYVEVGLTADVLPGC